MGHKITILRSSNNKEDIASFLAYATRIGMTVEDDNPPGGEVTLRWDDKTVEKKVGRQAGNIWVKEDILIEDVIKLMDQHWRRGNHGTFAKDYLGISKSTFLRRLRYFEENFGGLREALAAGQVKFTNRPHSEKKE